MTQAEMTGGDTLLPTGEVQKSEYTSQDQMQHYIGTKQIQARPMNLGDYNKHKGWTIPPDENPAREGYLVKYSDSYESWSPKEVFEKAYLPMGEGNTSKITSEMVEDFIKEYTVTKIEEKTTVVTCELVNGFMMVESSSCVSAENYDEEVGVTLCKERLENKVWELLGFLLQTARNGIK